MEIYMTFIESLGSDSSLESTTWFLYTYDLVKKNVHNASASSGSFSALRTSWKVLKYTGTIYSSRALRFWHLFGDYPTSNATQVSIKTQGTRHISIAFNCNIYFQKPWGTTLPESCFLTAN